jgi:hypothetical protein
MLKASQIDTSKVTDEQIGMCEKCFSGKTAFYMVTSESDSLKEYKVTWSMEFGFRCTCEAGQEAFAHCFNGYCKHVKWSVAAAREERAAMKELQAA